MTKSANTALITGASAGIGATYADRLARRGYDLILVARDRERMEKLSAQLRAETGVNIDILVADLTDSTALGLVETRLRDDSSIGLLVNNAGAATPGGYDGADVELLTRMIQLNVTAVTRLGAAVIPRFLAKREGSIINITSVVALAPEFSMGAYGATKAYVLMYSEALQEELGHRGLYVQAVLPGATRTEICERSERDISGHPGAMEVGDLVDAAMVGFDRRELITIPPLPELSQWEAFVSARKAMSPNLSRASPAERYRR